MTLHLVCMCVCVSVCHTQDGSVEHHADVLERTVACGALAAVLSFCEVCVCETLSDMHTHTHSQTHTALAAVLSFCEVCVCETYVWHLYVLACTCSLCWRTHTQISGEAVYWQRVLGCTWLTGHQRKVIAVQLDWQCSYVRPCLV